MNSISAERNTLSSLASRNKDCSLFVNRLKIGQRLVLPDGRRLCFLGRRDDLYCNASKVALGFATEESPLVPVSPEALLASAEHVFLFLFELTPCGTRVELLRASDLDENEILVEPTGQAEVFRQLCI